MDQYALHVEPAGIVGGGAGADGGAGTDADNDADGGAGTDADDDDTDGIFTPTVGSVQLVSPVLIFLQ